MRKLIFPFAILLAIGLFLRVWQVGSIPISLFGDEIDVGLQAHSILTTGNDYLGNRLPVLFHSFSEYRLPMQLYLSVPFIKLFGLNEVGVRTTSVLMGYLSLIFFYLLIRKISNNKMAAIATLFLLFSPWHFNFSRQANDAGILLPFILAGTWSYLLGLKNNKYLVLSAVLFALSIYSYAISTLFTPLFVFSLLLIYRKELLKYKPKYLFMAGAFGLIVLSPYINQVIAGTASSRFSYISVLNKDDLISEVIKERSWSDSKIGRLFYNKYTAASYKLTNNYLKSISSDFLFVSGDPNGRQSVSGFGMMYHFDIILVAIGSFVLIYKLVFEKYKRKENLLILAWLFLAPLPSILTKDGGTHASRLILLLPPLIYLSATGFEQLLNKSKNIKYKIIIILFILVMFFDVGRFIHRYFVIWPNEGWRIWQYGFKDVITDVKKVDADYERIYFNNTYEPILPRFLFWYGYDMNLFQEQFTGDIHIEGIIPGFNGYSLGDKYYFGELVKPIEPLAKKGHLVVASGEHDVTDPSIFKRSDLKLINTYYSPTNVPIFYTYTSN
jgi:4-amino-4-deoxy-L-arabinose transferase-like glycosyltransferase